MQGSPTFCTKGYEGEDDLQVGSHVHLKLPIDGDAFYMQLDSAGHESLKGTIKDIKNEIKARVNAIEIAATGGPDKTATEVVTEDKDKQARLLVWAEQAKDAIEQALSFTGEFMGLGVDKGGEIVFNTKWAVAEQKRIENDEREAKRFDAELAQMKADSTIV